MTFCGGYSADLQRIAYGDQRSPQRRRNSQNQKEYHQYRHMSRYLDVILLYHQVDGLYHQFNLLRIRRRHLILITNYEL